MCTGLGEAPSESQGGHLLSTGSPLSPAAAGVGAATQVGSATARLETGSERWGAEPQPCFGDKEETGAFPQWLGQLVHRQAGGRSGILQLKGFFWPEIANILQT